MTNPRTLLLSIAATACSFTLALIGVAGPAPIASTRTVGAATASGLIAAVAEDASRLDPIMFAVTPEPAASDPAHRSMPPTGTTAQILSMVEHDGRIHTAHGGKSLAAWKRR